MALINPVSTPASSNSDTAPQLGPSSATMVELASGVDALYLSGRASVSPAWIVRLEELRTMALELGRPAPLSIDGEELLSIPTG